MQGDIPGILPLSWPQANSLCRNQSFLAALPVQSTRTGTMKLIELHMPSKMPLSNSILQSQGVSLWLASPPHMNLCPFSLHKLQANSSHINSPALQSVHAQYKSSMLDSTEAQRKRPSTAGPLQRLFQESPLLTTPYLQYMMDEWCSPYSSWLRTMKGCS